ARTLANFRANTKKTTHLHRDRHTMKYRHGIQSKRRVHPHINTSYTACHREKRRKDERRGRERVSKRERERRGDWLCIPRLNLTQLRRLPQQTNPLVCCDPCVCVCVCVCVCEIGRA